MAEQKMVRVDYKGTVTKNIGLKTGGSLCLKPGKHMYKVDEFKLAMEHPDFKDLTDKSMLVRCDDETKEKPTTADEPTESEDSE